MGRPVINMRGQRFGHFLVLEQAASTPNGVAQWHCVCDCGTKRTLPGTYLRSGRSRSCGCGRAELATKHGRSASPEYAAWHAMKQRCYQPSTRRYELYGGAGVTVCDHWRDDFAQFLADMGPKPSGKHSLDKDHGPRQYWCHLCGGDVRWATALEQAATTRHNPISNLNLRNARGSGDE